MAAVVAVAADDKPKPAATFECRRTDGPITIDGTADEPAWKSAQVIDEFSLPWLKEKSRPARTATRARLLWDDKHLYFFADMDDADLYADVKEHDGSIWNNDVFELFFKPADDQPGYYEFQVSPANARLDCFMPRRGAGGFARFKSDQEFDFETRVQLRGTLNNWRDKDQGWAVEGKLAWKDFEPTGGRPADNATWKFTLCRYDYSVAFEGPELSTCAPLTVPNFHRYEDYAKLKFVGKPKEATKPVSIRQRVPLTTSRVIGSPDPPLPLRAVRAFPQLKLSFPLALKRLPGTDRLLILWQEKSSGTTTLSWVHDRTDIATAEKLLVMPEGGVAYGIAFHPRFSENGFVYLGWNGALDGGPKKSRVTRYRLDPKPPHELDEKSAQEIIAWESNGHNGADLTFGLDGMLYITSGDGTSDSDTNLTGQDMSKLLAKVLRIDVDHPTDGKQYSVPQDNPFVGRDGFVPEMWAAGLRNPWRITTDEKTGDIWVGNNGQDLWEQIYFVRKGDNYGWSTYEGSQPFYLERKMGTPNHTLPAAEHPHSEARSLTGGVVYYGEQHPELRGQYIYGDHSTGKIWAVKHEAGKFTSPRLLADTTLNISGFGVDTRGEILVADHRGNGEGAFYYLEPTPLVTSETPFPRKLSESGLFTSVAGHQMQPGVIPYSVNAPLWSDGAHKERFIAIPHKEGEDMRIGNGGNRGWDFPDEAVLIKSFALEMRPGDPSSRKWIETRFITRQAGEWAGYSYIWNDQQTDAELVPAEGLDKTFELRGEPTSDNPEGLTRQTWRYPSRTECMVCHARAAKFVLGPTTLQMDKDHDYGGEVVNQLQYLHELGMLKTKSPDLPAKSEKNDSKTASSAPAGDPPAKYPKLVDPYDAAQPLEARARSYLHANCAICHVEAGGGNAQIQLEYTVDRAKMNLFNAQPVHHTFNLADARLVAPGHPERSVLLHRIAMRGPGQMPQLATSIVDREAVKLFEAWIREMKPVEPAK